MNINNPKARDKVLNLIIECNLIDPWRELNLENMQYTWRKKNTRKQARLDFFLISESLFMDVTNSKILPGYRTDHSQILLQFDFGKFVKGNSYWKFNNSLLRDSKFIEEIKELIRTIKSNYILNEGIDETNINEISAQHLLFSISDQLFFDTLLMEIRGKTIAYSSYKKKMEINHENKLLDEIEKLEKANNINHELLQRKRNELQDIRNKKMEGVKIRSRARWISDGEKVTKYFCNLENRNFVSKCMNSLKNKEGEIISEQSEILKETMQFYKKLYSIKDRNATDLESLLGNYDIPRLCESNKNKLEGPITYSELLFCLKKTSNNSSPGFDGYTYDFFKFFWNDIGAFLLRAINECFVKGELSDSLKYGVITCLPKGNKDKLYLKNWRPISLLNTSYKLASACIAERLKCVLPYIINEDQTGFISGRFIGENIRLLYDVIEYAEKNAIPGMLLLIDFEKAFDTVSWDFLFDVLDFFNFGNDFKQWIYVFYKNIQSCVIVNGHLSEWFYLQRGCRQGDPLSPYLFILCAEILAALIRNNKAIKGIKMETTSFVISQYADDTTLILDGSKKSLENCLKVLKLYGDISGLCINMDKTKLIWIGSEKNSKVTFCEEHNLCWDNSEFTVLGVKFPKDLDKITEINYSSKIEEMKKVFLSWSKRILTPLGRITVIKSLALSKMNHLIISLPKPSARLIREIQNMFYNYLWNGGPDKVKRSIIIQNYEKGGLKMIDLDSFFNSLRLTWLLRLLTTKSKYFTCTLDRYSVIKDCITFGSQFITERKLNNVSNKFWNDILRTYKTFIDLVTPQNFNDLMGVMLWRNKNIKVGDTSVFYNSWIENGILSIRDLMSSTGQLVSYEEFRRIYTVQTNFLEFYGLIASVRNYINALNIREITELEMGPIRPLPLNIILNTKKAAEIFTSVI